MESASKRIADTISSNTMITEKLRYRTWDNLEQGILLKIFMTLHVMDLVDGMSEVCTRWNSVCRDPRLWEKLDLSEVTLHPNITQNSHNWYVQQRFKLRRFLKAALRLASGNLSCLIFNINVVITDECLIYTSKRTSNLKRLVLTPQISKLTVAGFEVCIKNWAALESMTMPICFNCLEMVKLIGAHCKKFSELKLYTCPFDMSIAEAIVTNIPHIKVLSLQCNIVVKEAFVYLVDNMENLEVLNLSHCLILDYDLPSRGYDCGMGTWKAKY